MLKPSVLRPAKLQVLYKSGSLSCVTGEAAVKVRQLVAGRQGWEGDTQPIFQPKIKGNSTEMGRGGNPKDCIHSPA